MAKTSAELEAQRRYREKNRELLRAKGREYQARRRAEDPEYAERQRQRSRDMTPEQRREAMQRWYAKHGAAYMRRWRTEHPERAAATQLRWRERNPERYRELGLKHSSARRARVAGSAQIEQIERNTIFARDGGRCHICGHRCSPDAFELDHLVPLSKGGEHTAANLATAHAKCNRRRGAGRLPAQLRLVG